MMHTLHFGVKIKKNFVENEAATTFDTLNMGLRIPA
jgi:hypothetical protein